jgi:hypothetical protein
MTFGCYDPEPEEEGASGFDGVHTPDNPYCDDPSCWCHTDADYHEIVIHPQATDAEIAQAFSYFGLQVGGGQS